MRPHALALALGAIVLGLPAAAQDSGRAVAEQFATIMDADGDGTMSAQEVRAFADTAFGSVDTDENGALSVAEMIDWQYGFAELAAFRDRTQAFETTVAVIHDMFDRDNDGLVTTEEHDDAILRSVEYSDLDGDGTLTREEYLGGFIYNIAMRNALDAAR